MVAAHNLMGLPLVSVGMPVKNGGQSLAIALDSILNQDYPNLEIIVSDNFSDDDTAQIIDEYAANDSRIRRIKPAEPLTALGNFEFVFRNAVGEFFMWAAHDDVRSPNYVRQLVQCMQQSASCVLSFGDLYITSEVGGKGTKKSFEFASRGRSRLARMQMAALRQCYHIYGVWRTSVLTNVRFVSNPWWPDLPLMIYAAAAGEFCYVSGARFSYFEIPKTPEQRIQYQDRLSGFGLSARVSRTLRLPIATYQTIRPSAGIGLGLVSMYVVVLRILRDGLIYLRRKARI